MATPAHQLQEGSPRRLVFLLDAANGIERRMLHQWIEEHRDPGTPWDAVRLPSSRRTRRRGSVDPRLEACLAADDDPMLVPLRVIWIPRKIRGGPWRRLARLLVFGDPRDPGRLRALIARRRPGRCEVLAAESATASELRARWRRSAADGGGEPIGLADFVARQAALALERAERRVRGLRYKVPRFVAEELVSRPAFRGQVARLAQELGRDEASTMRQAQRYLREIAATHSPYIIDVVALLIRALYTQAYGEALRYDRAELERVYALAQRYPVVFLPSHKSNLDHLVLQYMLHENGHPPNHTAGGINMNFFPVGPLVRRSGVFFIRRTFKDNAVYKLVLRHYIDYLVEKRFTLEWYIEGGRSRSGKLLPPRYGLLHNVVDGWRRGKSEDVILLPVAIAYDQMQDVGAYTAEQRGGQKPRESFGWLVGVVRGLRQRYGDIHIRFGEPVSLAALLGPQDPHAEPRTLDEGEPEQLQIQKLAFEVAVRINGAMPITPTSLAALTLLGRNDRALTVDETVASLENVIWYIGRRRLPTTAPLDVLSTPEGVAPVLKQLEENGVVTCYDAGPEPVYAVAPEQHLVAAYYRNSILHFFVNAAIAELALLRAAQEHEEDRRGAFWQEALRLRDLLKFEFFFAEKERFREELWEEIALHDPKWESALAYGPAAIQGVVRSFRPFSAHRVLRPFLQGYQVVADMLVRQPAGATLDQAKFLRDCNGLATQYLLQKRIRSAESISTVLFESALKLARNRGLVDPGTPELTARRKAFAGEIRSAIRRCDAIEVMVLNRMAGLIT